MTSIMPRSPVVDSARNARPEWREYIGAVEASIKILESLGLDDGPIQVMAALKARLAALEARITALPDKAINQHERLVMWRGTVVNSTGPATFDHNLGTRNIWWQIREMTSGGTLVAASFGTELDFSNEGAVRIHVGAGTFDATIYGVISDRY